MMGRRIGISEADGVKVHYIPVKFELSVQARVWPVYWNIKERYNRFNSCLW
jgi:hypothetical protein